MAAVLVQGEQQVNDVHSALNPTWVRETIDVRSVGGIRSALRRARRRGLPLSICGGRHAMGGQQFATDALLLDTRKMRRVLGFDRARGLVEAEAGIQWPELIAWLRRVQQGEPNPWGVAQKQTGADDFTLGGSLSANIHGRGLAMRPFIGDIEAFSLVDAEGTVRRCSRTQEVDLFRLAVGGYGLFGVIASVTLRLAHVRKLRRVVDIIDLDALLPALAERIAAGHLYGDFQFAIDPHSEAFLRRGVLSSYQPLADATPMPERQLSLGDQDWERLIHLAHTDKSAAFDRYAGFYLATSGQIYWSDTQQLSTYLVGYHRRLDAQLGHRGSEEITEIYVPRPALVDFMAAAAADFRAHGVDLIYGTVRLIRRDEESFLPWARQDYACVIFNLHACHSAAGKAHTAAALRRLIEMAIARDGSFYLTYHRHATRAQVARCYPGFRDFLAVKLVHDPQELFQSDWYRHYRNLFAQEPCHDGEQAQQDRIGRRCQPGVSA